MIDALVVGAGWSGLAAAVGLVEAGLRPQVIEAAQHPGGRARKQTLALAENLSVEVDNGQHLLIGAYRSTLALMGRIGVNVPSVLHRRPLALVDPKGFCFRAARLPAPLHLAMGLVQARGLRVADKWAIARLTGQLKLTGPDAVGADMTVSDWLTASQQSPQLIEQLWAPLCVGALNTPPQEACARTFARVLNDALLGPARDSDFLLPAHTLGELIPEPVTRWLLERGARFEWGCTCTAITPTGAQGWRVETSKGPIEARQLVVTVPPHQVPRLLQAALPAEALMDFARVDYAAIATVWLAWSEPVALPEVTLLTEHPDTQAFGQWLFRRSPPEEGPIRALAGVVISVARLQHLSAQEIGAAVVSQVQTQLGVPAARWARTVTERRATVRCTPDRPRIDTHRLAALAPGLWLAGDYVWHDYPATLESAIRAGDAAAQAIRASA